MPKLLFATPSPYSAKVRMAAAYAGIALEEVPTNTNDEPEQLLKNNPLGKIPVLLTDDGESLFDSRVITHISTVSRKTRSSRAIPPSGWRRKGWRRWRTASATACLPMSMSGVSGRENVHQPWLDKQWDKVTRALDHLEASPPKLPKKITAGQFALRACLGYLDLRFPGKWERGHSRLRRWTKRFDEKFPELATRAPH